MLFTSPSQPARDASVQGGGSPLHDAARYGSVEVAQLLLENKDAKDEVRFVRAARSPGGLNALI